jgi:outer membrane protein assembly factor BamB
MSEKYCLECGKIIPADSVYCPECGKKQTEEVTAPAPDVTWPMLRHDPASTGSDGSHLQAPLDKAWEFQASGEIESSLAAAYGMVFFGCKDNCVYAVEAASGGKKWTFRTGGVIATCPVVADGVVYVASKDRNLYAIEAESGQKRWQFSAAQEVSTLAVAYGMLFFGCKDKNVYAVDVATGQEKWKTKSDFKDYSAPIPFEGKVLISGSKKFFALDATNGSILWELKDYWSDPCPVILSGNIALVRGPKGGFNRIDVASGKDLGWASGDPLSTDASRVARSGDFMFVTFRFLQCLRAVDLSRPTIPGWDWVATIEEGTVSAPAAGGDFVFVASIGKRKLYGINTRKFMKRWEFDLNDDINSDPIVADEMMFVASDKGKIHAFKGARDPYAVTTLEYTSYEVAPVPKFRAMPWRYDVRWPHCCCLCCGPAEKTTSISKKEGLLTRWIKDLPYCTSCYDKTHISFLKELSGREYPGVEFSKLYPILGVLAFRNERYLAMFKEANRIR